jgi:hypothetical protein
MSRPVTSLAILALAGLAAAADDNAVSTTISGQIQVRAEMSNAYQDNAGPFSPADNANGKPDTLDLYLRRARLGAKFATANKQWSGSFVIAADNADQSGTASRTPALFQVFIARNFTSDEGATKQSLQGGLDYAWYNRASFGPSTTTLLPTLRATQGYMGQRGVGVGYKYLTKTVKVGVDIQNNSGDSVTATKTEREGLFYSGRVELSPAGEWNLDKYQETYAGAPGQGVLLGLELGYNNHDVSTAGVADTITSTAAIAAELLVRKDAFVGLVEARAQRAYTTVKNAGVESKGTTNAVAFIVQGGYAIPSDALSAGSALELAARLTLQNRNDINGNRTFGSGDYGPNGRQFEVGVTYYDVVELAKDGKGNKTGLVYTNWHAAEGGSQAHVVRIQHQFVF